MKPDDVNNYDDLTKLTVPKLRELAAEDTELKNTTALEKPALVDALAAAYNFEKPKQVKASGMQRLKKDMRKAKKKRDELLGAAPPQRDRAAIADVRTQMKRLKRKMRRLARAS